MRSLHVPDDRHDVPCFSMCYAAYIECPERQFVCRLFCDFRFGPIVRKLGSTSLWPRLGRWRHGSEISGEEVKGLHGGGVVLPNNTSQVSLTRTQERSESKRSVRSTSTSQQEQPNHGCPASDRVRKIFASRGRASFKKGHSHQSYDGFQENGAKCLRHRCAAVSPRLPTLLCRPCLSLPGRKYNMFPWGSGKQR